MWRVAFIFVVLFPCVAFAECVSVEKITKCARLPEKEFYHSVITDRKYDDSSWGGVYNGHVVDGYGVLTGGVFYDTMCVIAFPFAAEAHCYGGPVSTSDANRNCGSVLRCDITPVFGGATRLDGDICPDGFYTVPYEVSCGDGLIDVSGLPQCDSDMSGDYCLIGEVKTPCAAGITTLLTGTGLSIPLWAERGTEPSLCVKYNDTVCYGNLEPGQATNTINVNYNGVVYHMVD